MAGKLKHKKLRNTGLLYELLIRQLTTDVLNNNTPTSIAIIKKYFKKDSPLQEELHLYETILNQKVRDSSFALKIVEAVIEARSTIDNRELSKQKYGLIKEISSKFDQNIFFKSRIDNYPIYASVCKLLECNEKENPIEYAENKLIVAQHILTPLNESKAVEKEFKDVDPEMRMITFKLLVEKFNAKWNNLNTYQKDLLRHFITNSIVNKDTRAYVKEKVGFIRENINTAIKNPPSEIVKIKLEEIVKLLTKIEDAPVTTENHYLALIRYHELLKELKCPV